MIKRLLITAALTLGFFQEVGSFTLGPHYFYIGPEFSYVKRTREGGSRQSSFMYGGHFLYERMAGNSLYWALDAYYTTGNAHGKTGSGSKLKSTFTDSQVEGRFGLTWHLPYLNRLFLTPYVAYGAFYSTNRFHHPSPISCELQDSFRYGACGLITTWSIRESLVVGIDFRGKYMLNGKDRVTHDHEHDDVKLDIECMWQYELDIPIEFITCVYGRNVSLRAVPFYRFRHLGGKPNYPYDFFETKYRIYGLQALLQIGF